MILFDHFTNDEPDNVWSEICRSCVEEHHIAHARLDGEGQTINQCGVIGCQNEADFYIYQLKPLTDEKYAMLPMSRKTVHAVVSSGGNIVGAYNLSSTAEEICDRLGGDYRVETIDFIEEFDFS